MACNRDIFTFTYFCICEIYIFTVKLKSEYLYAKLRLLVPQKKILLTSTGLQKALFGNNVLMFVQKGARSMVGKTRDLAAIVQERCRNRYIIYL
jgi:hypothetical protein